MKEYYRRVKEIWRSELNSRNKSIAHNSFALSLLILTVGILDWTIQEIVEIDRRTRKFFCMAGSFHRTSDVNRLYVKRTEGGRGLKSFEDSFKLKPMLWPLVDILAEIEKGTTCFTTFTDMKNKD